MSAPVGTATIEESELTTWNGRVTVRVLSAGSGTPVVYLHGPAGLTWDPFLDGLAGEHRVLAPEHPGTSPGHDQDIKALDELWDLVLHYYDLFDRLGLEAPHVVGHSFGGMVAAELAATDPGRVGRLVLISPLGLWAEEEPIAHYQMMTREELAAAMVADPDGEAAAWLASLPEDEKARQDAEIHWMWSMGCAGKFTWPIPERGLHKRLHRITSPTLVVWGDGDRIAPPSYARRWSDGLPAATVCMVEGAGHAPQLERPAETRERVTGFLAEG